MENVKLEVDVG